MADALQQSLADLRVASDASLRELAQLSAQEWDILRQAIAEMEQREITRIRASLVAPSAEA